MARVFGGVFLRSDVSKINRPEFSARSVAANALGLGPRDRRCKSCRADHFQIAAVVEYIRHPPSKRNDAGETAVRESEHFYLGHLTSRTWEVHPVGSSIAR